MQLDSLQYPHNPALPLSLVFLRGPTTTRCATSNRPRWLPAPALSRAFDGASAQDAPQWCVHRGELNTSNLLKEHPVEELHQRRGTTWEAALRRRPLFRADPVRCSSARRPLGLQPGLSRRSGFLCLGASGPSPRPCGLCGLAVRLVRGSGSFPGSLQPARRGLIEAGTKASSSL